METMLRRSLAVVLLLAVAIPAAAATRTIQIFQKRRIVIAVPERWKFEHSKNNDTGLQTIEVEDRSGDVKISATFHPDADGKHQSGEQIVERMRELFAEAREKAGQQEMKVELSETVDGALGQATFTYGEGDHTTAGVRSWPGVYVLFTIRAKDLESEAYRKALDFVSGGIREVAK